MNNSSEEPTKGQAFLKGGCGCLMLFVVLGFFVVLIGGNVHADFAGILMLFLIGGTIGLVVRGIYNKGRRDSRNS